MFPTLIPPTRPSEDRKVEVSRFLRDKNKDMTSHHSKNSKKKLVR